MVFGGIFRTTIQGVVSHLFFSVGELFAPEARVWLDLLEASADLKLKPSSGSAPRHLEVRTIVLVLDDNDRIFNEFLKGDYAASGSADVAGVSKQSLLSGRRNDVDLDGKNRSAPSLLP
jgi:hypothetical protein